MTERLKLSLFLSFPLGLLLLCLLFPSACTQGIRQGLLVVTDAALPALFPALVLSRMLGFLCAERRGKGILFLPPLLGLLCGFPVGASLVSVLVREGSLSKAQGKKMLFFCNNPGPAFLILLCGKELMGKALYGWYLFAVQAILVGVSFLLLFRQELRTLSKNERTPLSTPPSFAAMTVRSLSEAASSFLFIGSCILFFSFLRSLLSTVFSPALLCDTVLALFLELTGGVRALTALSKDIAFPLCAAAAGFGGMAVHLQTLGVLEGSGISTKLYWCGKLFFGAVLCIAAEIFQKCL